MAKCLPAALLLLAALVPAPAGAATAVVIDGVLDPLYGPALATQTTQTTFADTPDPYGGVGTELDQAYGFVADGVLYLFLTGDMGFCCGFEFSHQEEFDLFFDARPGGQNQLRADNPNAGCCWTDPHPNALHCLAGLRFDSDFEADYWIETTINLSSWYATLPTGGSGTGYYLGAAPGGGTLTGGTNPAGIVAAISNANAAGVTTGCAAASGAGVTTGLELAIPLAALGDTVDCVKVCVIAAAAGGTYIGNQVLGPLPAGTCALVDPASVDLSTQPGAQYFTVCPQPLQPTRSTTWGRLKTIYR